MSAVVESSQCFPKALTIGTFTFPAPEACHERCPGGHTIPGVMGGWVCPCECHRVLRNDGTMDGINESK